MMKKVLILFIGTLLTSALNARAEKVYGAWTITSCNPGADGLYETVYTSEETAIINFYSYEATVSALHMDCNNPGSNCCDWLVVSGPKPVTFSQAQVNQIVASQIAQGNLSGQIYSNGTPGNSDPDNIVWDGVTPCFLWKIEGYDANNNPILKTTILDYLNQN